MADTKMRMGKLDSGIILRADGGVEVLVPRVAEENMPESGLIARVLFHAALHPELLRDLLNRLAEHERLN